MLGRLQDLPRVESLRRFLEALLSKRKGRVRSVILFGSMAKGNYTPHSDYDVFIVVEGEEARFIDRLSDYSSFSDGWVEPFTYTVEEVESMLRSYHPLLLDTLKDGIVLYDIGFWKLLREKFRRLLSEGIITPKKNGWDIAAPWRKASESND